MSEESDKIVAGGSNSTDKARVVERSIITTYRAKIWARFTAAVREYRLIEPGDRIAVCISGGKDSTLLAKCIQELKRHGRDNFEAAYLVMDPGYDAENRRVIENNVRLLGIPAVFFDTDIYDAVAAAGGSPCYLCARMRRGNLYAKAKELGCNKIALGHHFDDAVETLLMGMLNNGRFRAMMPRVRSQNFDGMELIRPLYRVAEADIINWRNHNGLQFIRCACRFTDNCEIRGGGSQRRETKELIAALRKKNPNAAVNIFNSMYNVDLATVVSSIDKAGETHSFLDDY
jgi:tRNA(Ile)-lysidine synthase TilS/MesJ